MTIGGNGGNGGAGGRGGRGGTGGPGGDGGDGGGGAGAAGGSGTFTPSGAVGGRGGPRGLGGPGGTPGAAGPGGDGGLGGSGILEILAGASFLNSGDVIVGGTGGRGSGKLDNFGALNNAGTITLHANGTLTNQVGGIINNDGEIDAAAISNWTNSGTLTGTGLIIGDFINEGIFAPGNSAGMHTIDGNYDERGTLNIEIGGLIAGTEYDFVDVTGLNRSVSLDGATSTLEISFLDGFNASELSVGDEFDIIRYTGSLQGTFSSMVQPLDSPGLFEIDYADDGSLTLRVTRTSPLSDLTGNGFVDFEDLTVLLANWNKEVGADAGNLVNADTTVVNFEDLTVLLAAWTGPGPAGSPGAALGNEAVPEPSSLVLAVLGLLGLVGFRRRRA
ncbi:MAG: PEP-CTERM sorting domain-containing protein [Planctomycetes bacterium]|nr:PEP-CTERM sorting domain-containing protein [Planctomycetota bacterium]